MALDPITVVATKTEEKAIDTLAGVSVLRQGDIDQIMPTRTADLFYGLPSVWFQTRGDQPETSINIRGLQDFGRVAVLIDGARQNFQRSGHNANGTFFLEPELLAGVDVVRGPVANIYGSGAIGGVASFRTKDADDILRPGERWAAQGHVMGAIERLAARARLDLHRGAAQPQRRPVRRRDLSLHDQLPGRPRRSRSPTPRTRSRPRIGKVTVRPADGHEVKLGGINYDAWYKTGQLVPNQESVLRHQRDQQHRERALALQPARRPHLRLRRQRLLDQTTKQDQVKIANGTPGSLGNPITGFVGDPRSFSIDTKGFDVHNTSRFDLGPFRNAFTYGGDFFRDEVENVDQTGNGEVTTPSGARTVSGAFAQWKLNYATWFEAISALRYDNYRLEGNGTTSEGDHLSPKTTRRHHAACRLHRSTAPTRKATARRPSPRPWSPARIRRSRPASPTCSPSCPIPACGRRSARPRRSAST